MQSTINCTVITLAISKLHHQFPARVNDFIKRPNFQKLFEKFGLTFLGDQIDFRKSSKKSMDLFLGALIFLGRF